MPVAGNFSDNPMRRPLGAETCLNEDRDAMSNMDNNQCCRRQQVETAEYPKNCYLVGGPEIVAQDRRREE